MTRLIETLEARQLMASGTLDPSFGDGGTRTTRIALGADEGTLNSPVNPVQVIVDAGGRTTVLTRTTSSLTLYRLTETGQLDTAFAAATNGYLRMRIPSTLGGLLSDVHMAQDANFRTYVQIGPQVVRLTAGGRVDSTYGIRGNAPLYAADANFTGAQDIVVEPDGSAYVVGSTVVGGLNRMAIAKITPGGVLDTRFGTKGLVVAPPTGASVDNPGDSYGNRIRILNNGMIQAAGYIDVDLPDGHQFDRVNGTIALRFTGKGKIDTTYGKSGKSVVTVASDTAHFRNVAPVSIRGDGAVFHYGYDLTSGADTFANYLTNANGRATTAIDITPHSDGYAEQGQFLTDTNVFAGDNGGFSELFVNRTDKTLIRFNHTSGTYTPDTTFNGGTPIGGIQLAATTGGGAIVLGSTGRSATDNLVTVARVFATEAPSIQGLVPVVTRPTKQVFVDVIVRDDKQVVMERVDGTPTGATLDGPNGLIDGAIVQNSNVALRYAFTGPGGSWDKADNGSYDIIISFDDVLHDNEGNYVGRKLLGKLFVAIP